MLDRLRCWVMKALFMMAQCFEGFLCFRRFAPLIGGVSFVGLRFLFGF